MTQNTQHSHQRVTATPRHEAARARHWLSAVLVAGSVRRGAEGDWYNQRQILRFISVLKNVKQREGSFILSIFWIPKTISTQFLLLCKFGMNENGVHALESYYKHSHMRVIHADGGKSARIPLHHGLRQGCPLLLISGGYMVNAMLQWLDFKGRGLSQGDVLTNALCLTNYSTLMTTNVYEMNALFACVNLHCK